MSEIPIRELTSESLRHFQQQQQNNQPSADKGFGDMLKEMVGDVNELQGKAKDSIHALTRGEVQDLHQVMIQMNKAELGFKFMMEVRNKLIEAYKEVSQMTV